MRVLELSHNLLSADGVAELSRACWPELITLGIRNTFDQAQVEDACRHLADSRWPKLTSLDVSQNPLSAASVASLLKGQWSAVQTLSLETCFLWNNAEGIDDSRSQPLGLVIVGASFLSTNLSKYLTWKVTQPLGLVIVGASILSLKLSKYLTWKVTQPLVIP